MSISYKKTIAVFEQQCEIEEAEALLEWLLENPKGKLNLKQCDHFHTAILQVMMALQPSISVWPEDEVMKQWLQQTLIEN